MGIDYYAYHSGMRDWNTSIKLGFGMGTLVLVVGLNSPAVSALSLAAMNLLVLAAARVSWKDWLRLLAVPLFFVLFSSLVIALEILDAPKGDWNLQLGMGFLCLSRRGLWLAARVFLKGSAGASALLMMALSTPMGEWIAVFRKLHLPELIITLMYLIYRYLFLLLELTGQMRMAARARLGDRTLRQSFQCFAKIAGNLLVLSLEKSDACYDAMLSRGYRGSLCFWTETRPIKWKQVVLMAVYFAILAGTFLYTA